MILIRKIDEPAVQIHLGYKHWKEGKGSGTENLGLGEAQLALIRLKNTMLL